VGHSITYGLYLFVFEGNGGKLEHELGKGHEQDHEQNGFTPKPYTACLEFDYILSRYV
jgi:hypothetical protein